MTARGCKTWNTKDFKGQFSYEFYEASRAY